MATLMVLSVTFAAAVSLDFEQIEDGKALDADGLQCASIRGEARLSTDAHQGGSSLELRGASAKGVVDFGSAFGRDAQATICFWCKPAALGGIMAGKYGAINIEIVQGSGVVGFGLKLKSGWIHCKSPDKAIAPGEWTQITASWGPQGMLLLVNGEIKARAELPEKLEWFLEDRPFLLGCYSWPPDYDVWCFAGLIDEFSYVPEQQALSGKLPAAPVKLPELLLPETPRPAYGSPVPQRIDGRVVLDANGDAVADPGEAGLPGVSVSDGYSVVKTDAQGSYSITPSGNAVFVFLTRPSGHDVSGHWYKPVGETVDFTVRPEKSDETQFTFVQLTDAHISSLRQSLEGLSQFVSEVNDLQPAPRFVFNSGDLVNLDKQLTVSEQVGHAYFRSYVGTMNHLSMPFYNVAGDHTDSRYRLAEFPPGDHRAGKAMYWEYLGPHFFSFEYGPLHFASIDTVYHLKDERFIGLIPEHVNWLREDLANRTPGTYSLTVSEHHLEGFAPGFVELAGEQDIRLQLVGDNHVVAEKKRPVPSRIHGALSGTWWTGRCADLSPQGYMIYQLQGQSLECFYKGLGERVAIVSPRYGSGVRGRCTVQAHLVQPQPGERLELSVAGGDWQPMTQVGRPFYRALYEAAPDTTGVPDGLVEFRVRLVPGGETRTWVLAVDNGKPSPARTDSGELSFSVGDVIGATLKPTAAVKVLINGTAVGELAADSSGKRTIQVPADVLRKVNVLSFDAGDSRAPFSITHPALRVGQRSIEDPRAGEIRRVQSAHWEESVVKRAGFAIGEDPYQSSFCLAQDRFYFVIPEAE